MDAVTLQKQLADLPLGEMRYFESIGSTNDEAISWAAQGAGEFSLVVAGEQTNGRGRAGRSWHSPAGSSLSFSLILRPKDTGEHLISRITALGALAVCQALDKQFDLSAEIKWPNDVLLQRKKVAGVLVEAFWSGDNLDAVILGIGINIAAESAMFAAQQEGQLRFPVTSISEQLGSLVTPEQLLHAILSELISWQPRISRQVFISTWEAYLAFRGEIVQITNNVSSERGNLQTMKEKSLPFWHEGRIIGLAQDGSLKLRLTSGDMVKAHFGEVRLRPLEQRLDKIAESSGY